MAFLAWRKVPRRLGSRHDLAGGVPASRFAPTRAVDSAINHLGTSVPRRVFALLLASVVWVSTLGGQEPPCPPSCPTDSSLFVAIYWKARPGREPEYEEYIRKVAEPIDQEAHRAGAFEELRTYLPETPNGEWTHLRVFRFKDRAQLDAFSARMDDAGKRIYPDPTKRPKADDLRDLVKRETWRGFR